MVVTMTRLRRHFGSSLGQWALVGFTVAGALGAVAGLIIGLIVYAPTAPFAAVELGLPAALVGAGMGAVAALGVKAVNGIKGGR